MNPTLTLEQYLQTPFEVEPDYVDGRLEERHVGEYPHARMKGRLVTALSSFGKSTVEQACSESACL